MGTADNLFLKALGAKRYDRKELSELSAATGISMTLLKNYNDTNTLPSGKDMERICRTCNISEMELALKMGRLDAEIISAIRKNADAVYSILKGEEESSPDEDGEKPPLAFETELGELYQGDCLALMPSLPAESVDLIFADPPFNLNKLYPSKINDNLKEAQYLKWCERWAQACIRLLKPGGSFFIWNLPKWNISMAEFLKGRLTFRDWIAVDIKYSLPIAGRLYPSHYSLLYFCKGKKPARFSPDRLPMEICPHCMGDLKDYGGYKGKMNPRGVNITDVWYDIPPVRHAKYKKRQNGNELSVRLMDRIIEMASEEGDLLFDPFGGAGTTYTVAEIKKRRWIGIEIGPVDEILRRLTDIRGEREYLEKIRRYYNHLFPENVLEKRRRNGLWTAEVCGEDKDEGRGRQLLLNL